MTRRANVRTRTGRIQFPETAAKTFLLSERQRLVRKAKQNVLPPSFFYLSNDRIIIERLIRNADFCSERVAKAADLKLCHSRFGFGVQYTYASFPTDASSKFQAVDPNSFFHRE